MMDLNTNLRDDKFLFPVERENVARKCQVSGIIVSALNKRGIFTVNDLINYDNTKFRRENSHYLGALTEILKYKYLGQEFLFDVILESEYANIEKDRKKLAKDLRRLGFGRDQISLKYYVEKIMMGHSKITMEEVLRFIGEMLKDRFIRSRYLLMGNANFVGFYLDYIEEKKKQHQDEQNASQKTILEGLKMQLEGLVKMRDEVDVQIQYVQNKISELNGEQLNGRK